MWFFVLLIACHNGTSVSPATTADDRGLVLFSGAHEVVLQHDELFGARIAPDIEIYAVDGPSAQPGDLVDIWVSDTDPTRTISHIETIGGSSLPARHRADGWPLTGEVVRVDATALMVDHEAVAGLMSAMVMPFDVRPGATVDLEPGDRISAKIVVSAYGYALVDVQKTADGQGAEQPEAPLEVGQALPRTELDGVPGEVVLGQAQGVPTLVAFIYTTCPDPSVCPATVSRLQGIAPRLPADSRIVAVTIDPETDTLEVLGRFREQVGAGDRWLFARPRPVQLHPLAIAAGLTVSMRSGRISHSTRLLVLDGEGRLLARYEDNAFDADDVLALLGGSDLLEPVP